MKGAVKRIAVGLGGLLALALLVVGALYAFGSSRWGGPHEVETAALELPTDSTEIARGAHLAETNGCTDCHGADLSGAVFEDAPPFRVTAANLTPGRGGIGEEYSVEDWDRAIRHGVRPDGTPLFIMPSAAFHNMSDRDAAALIAWLRTVPPVDNELPPTEVRALGKVLASFALDPTMEVRTERPGLRTSPAPAPTAEFGAYLANLTCAYCHGENLAGAEAKVPGSPSPPDLLAGSASWSLEEWDRALTTGIRPDGTTMVAEYMPWQVTAAMTEVEREALYRYVQALAGG